MERLLIFVKEPVPGCVKTRLAASLGAEAACAIYQACAELTLERLRAWRAQAVVCVDPPEALARVERWLGGGWAVHPQQGATLGERLAGATRQAFAEGARRVVVIGTDSPWLRPADLDAAFRALQTSDAVLGPAEDGGYYLVGLARPIPALFADIAWSSSEVYAQTQRNACALGLRVQELSRGYDLDQIADVERFLQDERRRGPLPAAVQMVDALMHRRQPCPN